MAKASAIDGAIDQIEAEGFDWSPKPEEEEDDGIYSINDPLPDLSDFDFEEDDEQVVTRTDIASLRSDMLRRLDELESLILAARPPHGGIGHNNPPAPIRPRSLPGVRSFRLFPLIEAARKHVRFFLTGAPALSRSCPLLRCAPVLGTSRPWPPVDRGTVLRDRSINQRKRP